MGRPKKNKTNKEEGIRRAQALMESINRTSGKNAITLVGSKRKEFTDPDSWISSGSLRLDEMLGGGYKRGRFIEIYGPNSGGKTTLCLHAIAECQKKGGIAAFVDAEHTLDPVYAESIGVNLETLLYNQPEAGEKTFDIIEKLITGEPHKGIPAADLIVIDSIAAIGTSHEIDKDHEDKNKPGNQAAMWSLAMRKINPVLGKSKCVMLATNQLRFKIGAYGNPETTPGGEAIKFYASVRLDIRQVSQGAINDKNTKQQMGKRVRIKCVKNKLAPPARVVELSIIFGVGIDQIAEIFENAMSLGIVERAGAWFYFNESIPIIVAGEKVSKLQGRDSCIEYLKDNSDAVEALRKEILNVQANST